MEGKRFIRDNILDNMIDEIYIIANKMSEGNMPAMFFNNSLNSLTEIYETNKIVLLHLESAIEAIREEDYSEETLNSVVEAAAHIKLSLVNLHETLKEDIDNSIKNLTDIKNEMEM